MILLFSTEPILEVSSSSSEVSDHHRVIWCPYIPDDQLDQSGAAAEDDGDEPAWLLVLTHGPNVCITHFHFNLPNVFLLKF